MASVKKGLKLVALLEASKGLIALLVCFGLHKLVGHNLQHFLEMAAGQLHLNPANHLVHKAFDEAAMVTPSNLQWVLAGCGLYAGVRLVEAYGLWHALVWTEWFALISGGLYLPFELYELVTKANLLSAAVLAINLAVVWYMYRVIRAKD
ncbi:DUF2127 domain-containing protein [Gallaecimonas kandeliae]|uniref:DUF2127 domain-containing protein n=1 Tax=Gallaecimonas kandeliae TaxID=3029055 RepID=UPI00264934EB|nr:DUF2127 domain-containing protein [Gallaecimonas kandeliae]WKE67122.1 DUF2127 domain-containing protein [Gallaecimonas kandeliae]